MKKHKTLNKRDDNGKLDVPRKESGRRLAYINDSVDTSMRVIDGYMKKIK